MRSFATLPVLISTLACWTAAKPELIRGVRDPIYHLYLQSYHEDRSIPVLGPQASAETFDIAGTIQSTNTSLYLNVDEAATSYKPLSFGESPVTDGWGLEGDTIITTQGSSLGRQLNFLVCELETGYWQLHLQTGNDQPAGRTCSNHQTIHLPCLC